MSLKPDQMNDAATPHVPLKSGQDSRYKSNDLFKGQNEIQIEHLGAEYRLRITRSGGLILNK